MRPVLIIRSEDSDSRTRRRGWLAEADELLYAIEEHNLTRGPHTALPSCIIADAIRLGVHRSAGHTGARMHDALLTVYKPWMLSVREVRAPRRRTPAAALAS